MNSAFDVRHPFFRPAWRRAVFTGVCLGWAAFEALNNNVIWASIFGVAGLYLLHQFFIKFDPKDYEERPNE